MSDIILMLCIEHKNMNRVLEALDHQFSAIDRREPIAIETVISGLEYCRTYPDRCHHPKENLIFRRLCLRDPQLCDELGDLQDDHAILGATVRTVADLAVESARGLPGSAAGLAEVGRHFIALYRRHMTLEEAVFFPAALRALTPEDWDELDFRVFDGVDPLFSDRVEQRFQALIADILAG